MRRDARGVVRCWWCGDDPLYVRYHDAEWGVPVHDDVRLFEKLSLEGFQAGLSWITILRKRERFREVFAGFDPAQVARFGARDVTRLLKDEGIVRHRGKIEAVVNNARLYGALRAEWGSLASFIWHHRPAESGHRRTRESIPAMTDESKALSAALKSRGWRFVGPTTVYALFQAMGVVNDHLVGCFRWSALVSADPVPPPGGRARQAAHGGHRAGAHR